MHNQKGFALIVIALIILALAGAGGTSYYLMNKQSAEQKACTAEVKVCSDGSSVGRIGPNCEFAACPEVNINKTSWAKYKLVEKNDTESQFPDFSLIGTRDDKTENVIVSNMRDLTKWTDMYYPREVSFPPYSDNIFFVKYLSEAGHSAGFYMLNVKTLELKELKTVGEIYENYYNYISIKSPNGLKIASLGYDNLYLLDLENDKATLLAQAKSGEVFYPAGNVPDFIWLNNNTIQYPIHYQKDIEEGVQEVIDKKIVKITDKQINQSDFSGTNKDTLLNKLMPTLFFKEGSALSSENYRFNLKDSIEDYFINNKEKSLLLIVEGQQYDLYLGLFDKNGNLLTNNYNFDSINSQWGYGRLDYYNCNGIKYILNTSTHCPTGGCCNNSAKLVKVSNGKFEVIQEINDLLSMKNNLLSLLPVVNAASPSFSLIMYPYEDKILIKKVPSESYNSDCPETDYKELKWNINNCKFE